MKLKKLTIKTNQNHIVAPSRTPQNYTIDVPD